MPSPAGPSSAPIRMKRYKASIPPLVKASGKKKPLVKGK